MNVLVDALVAADLVKGRIPQLDEDGERASFSITLAEYALLQALAIRILERRTPPLVIRAIEDATDRQVSRWHWIAALFDLDACGEYGNNVDLVAPTRAAAAHVGLLAQAYSITEREAINLLTAESLGMTFCASGSLLSESMRIALDERRVPLALVA